VVWCIFLAHGTFILLKDDGRDFVHELPFTAQYSRRMVRYGGFIARLIINLKKDQQKELPLLISSF